MKLQILKEGQLGYGLLLEKDAGFISKEFTTQLIESDAKLQLPKLDLSGPIYYYATLQKYGVENRNGRVYPENILKPEVDRYYEEVIKRNASFSEMDHPDESVISLKGGSPFRIVEIFWRGNVLIGKIEILVSDGYRRSGIISCNGDLLAHYLSYGMTVGVSSRGVGSLEKKNNRNEVQSDFELICWDAVSSPSTPGSYIYKDLNDYTRYNETLPDEEDYKKPTQETTKNKKLASLHKFLGIN